jgi:hypothetical protein
VFRPSLGPTQPPTGFRTLWDPPIQQCSDSLWDPPSLLHSFQTVCGTHLASNSVQTVCGTHLASNSVQNVCGTHPAFYLVCRPSVGPTQPPTVFRTSVGPTQPPTQCSDRLWDPPSLQHSVQTVCGPTSLQHSVQTVCGTHPASNTVFRTSVGPIQPPTVFRRSVGPTQPPTVFRPSVGPTQPPIQSVPEALSPVLTACSWPRKFTYTRVSEHVHPPMPPLPHALSWQPCSIKPRVNFLPSVWYRFLPRPDGVAGIGTLFLCFASVIYQQWQRHHTQPFHSITVELLVRWSTYRGKRRSLPGCI